MKQIGVKDLSITLPTSRWVCVGLEPAYKYRDGVKTDIQDGYQLDCVSPDLPGRGMTVKVKEVDEDVKPLKQVEFEGIQYTIYAPKEWDVKVAFRANKAKRKI